jgi:hypothetical protein
MRICFHKQSFLELSARRITHRGRSRSIGSASPQHHQYTRHLAAPSIQLRRHPPPQVAALRML